MNAPLSASQRARNAAKSGDLKGALKIVSGWRPSPLVSKEQLKVMVLGYECLVHPAFYVGMGKDVKACVTEAEKVFVSIFFKE